MPEYTCESCSKVFKRKMDLTKHNKTPCVNDNNNVDDKNNLMTMFKSCLNILRVEGLNGEKALRNLSYFLTLRLIEPHIGRDIDIDSYDYDYSNYEFYHDKEQLDKLKERMLNLVKFTNLVNNNVNNLTKDMDDLWYYILSQHPKTKPIFLPGKTFDLKEQSTYKKLIDKLNYYNILESSYDILGNAYEEVIKESATNRDFGQYFSMPIIKNFMINLIDPKVFQDGTIETISDPAMGTGGFLITSIKYLINKSKNMGIELDWNQVIKEGIYGREIVPDTYQLAMSNMLIYTGHVFDKLENGDSIRTNIRNNFDIIITNPPFGIQGLKYDEINRNINKDNQLPIKSDNAISLFLQTIIYMLKVEGRAAVVVSNGKDIDGRNKSLVSIREYLMKTCDLKEVIYLPPGIFTYTNIKTCILYFVKKVEDPFYYKNITIKGRGKTPDRTEEIRYFEDELQTEKVDFYNFNTSDSSKTLLVSVSADRIKNNSYSLKYEDYTKVEKPKIFNENIKYEKLGDICEFKNGKNLIKKNIIKGEYPVIGGGQSPMGYHNEYNNEENTILCSSSGAYAGFISMYSNKIWASDCFSIKPKDVNIINKYLYYILKNIQDDIYKLQNGSAQPHVYSSDMNDIKIPIPSVELQNKIVQDLDFVYEKLIRTTEENIKNLETYNKMYLETSIMIKDIERKTLVEVCEINNGTRIVKNRSERGEYPVYGSGNATFYTDEFNRENFNILIGRFALSLECVRLTNHKLFLNDSGLTIKPINLEIILHKYLGYYLINNNDLIYNCARGSAQKNLNMDDFKNIEIQIPPIEIQNKIVTELDKNNEIINELKNKIESYKTYAKEYLDKYLSQ